MWRFLVILGEITKGTWSSALVGYLGGAKACTTMTTNERF
jgi:hypothetical protein